MNDVLFLDSSNYETGVYERLEESFHEYLDDPEFTDKLVPHVKKILAKDIKERKDAYERVEGIFKTLFPEEELVVKKPVVLG